MTKALAIVLAVCTALAGSRAWAEEPVDDLLGVVPNSALGMLVVNRLHHTAEKIAALTASLQLGSINPLGLAKAATHISEGIDERGSLGVVLFGEDDGDRLAVAFVVPVSDYAKFLAPFKVRDFSEPIQRLTILGPVLAVHQRGFAVIVEARHERLLKEFTASTKSREKPAGPLHAWLSKQAVAVLTFEPGTRLLFDKLQRLRGQFEQSEAQAEKPTALPLSGILAAVIRLNGEVTHCGLGLELTSDAATVSFDAALKPNGQIAHEIAKTTWPAQPGLDALPAGEFVVASAGTLPQPWLVRLVRAKLSALGLQAASSAEQQNEFEQSTAALLKHISSIAVLLRPPASERSLLHQTVAVLRVDDAHAYLGAHEAYLQKLEELFKDARAAAVLTHVKKITLDGLPALEASADVSGIWPENAEAGGQAALVFEKLIGPDRQFTTYIAAVDEHHVAVCYGNRKGLLETAKMLPAGKTVLNEPGVQAAVALLPNDSSWVAVADGSRVAQLINSMLPAIAPSVRKLPEFPKTLPAVARLQFTPEVFDARVVLPQELIAKIGEYQVKLRQVEQQE